MRALSRAIQGLGNRLSNVKVDPVDALMFVGPDVGMAALAGALAPGGPNLGVGAEDLAISLLGTGAGFGIRAGARRFAGDRFKDMDPRMASALGFASDLGPSMVLQTMMPRPQLMGAIEAAARKEQEQQELLAQQQQLSNLEQLGLTGFAGGLLASPAFAPSPSLGVGLNTLV